MSDRHRIEGSKAGTRAGSAPERARELLRGTGTRQVRLVCGLVLFTYLTSHLLNHALGNISVNAMERGLYYQILFWQSLPASAALYLAALTHLGLGIWAVYERREFRWRAIEPLQLLLGLSIPLLVLFHVIGARLGQTLFHHEKLYPQQLYVFWVARPDRAVEIATVLGVAWLHGCIGLHFWLRMKRFYRHAAPFLLGAAVLVPTLALLGFVQGGREVVRESGSASWRTSNLAADKMGTAAEQVLLDRITDGSLSIYVGLLGAALLGRVLRDLHERRGGTVRLTYGNGRTVRIPKGLTVLEASLRHNVPHASVCGGRARCSTCRIRVIGDPAALPEPSPREAFVLNRVGSRDPAVRLACQLRPTADLAFFQLFTPGLHPSGQPARRSRAGEERYLVSLFVDMRGSTRLAEKRLPFDTVFIVNRFLAAVSEAVLSCGGQPNQFVGDGMLALFGLEGTSEAACGAALRAAGQIAANVAELNDFLSHDLPEPIRFGIGIHGGDVIVGDIGYRDHMIFTALGDPVNVAARLQDMTKNLDCEVIASDEVCLSAKLSADDLPRQDVTIRGRDGPIAVRVVAEARTLLARPGAGPTIAT